MSFKHDFVGITPLSFFFFFFFFLDGGEGERIVIV